METARSLIADQALHRRIVGVDDSDTFVCRPHPPGQLRDALTGRTLTAARRRGKTMWCETSGVGRSATPGPDLGIHLGMGGRIIVVSAGGRAAEGGGPRRPAAHPPKPVWNRVTLKFAAGGTLVLFDRRRLGRVRLNPDLDALGPDAAEVTGAQFRGLIMKGTVAVKARLLDQSKIAGVGEPAGRRGALAGPGAARGAGWPAAARGRGPALPRAAVRAQIRHRQGRRAHRGGHRGPASRRAVPALRRRDGARNGGRPVNLVVLARAGTDAAGSGRITWGHARADRLAITDGLRLTCTPSAWSCTRNVTPSRR